MEGNGGDWNSWNLEFLAGCSLKFEARLWGDLRAWLNYQVYLITCSCFRKRAFWSIKCWYKAPISQQEKWHRLCIRSERKSHKGRMSSTRASSGTSRRVSEWAIFAVQTFFSAALPHLSHPSLDLLRKMREFLWAPHSRLCHCSRTARATSLQPCHTAYRWYPLYLGLLWVLLVLPQEAPGSSNSFTLAQDWYK